MRKVDNECCILSLTLLMERNGVAGEHVAADDAPISCIGLLPTDVQAKVVFTPWHSPVGKR